MFRKGVQLGSNARERSGRGLGLAFCELAVASHGGSITIESSTPRGSILTVRLPVGWPG